ncbi:MAG TPA: BON domain-containing protein [Nitrospira sp.]|nr:BON domain-containing protein [Nitrospira sp.]
MQPFHCPSGSQRLARFWCPFYLLWIMVAGCALGAGSGLSDSPSDGAISKEVEAKLAGDQFVGLSEILVTTEAGVVMLVGTVERAEQKARAADLARQVKGVKRVKNDLEIHRTKASEAPTQ